MRPSSLGLACAAAFGIAEMAAGQPPREQFRPRVLLSNLADPMQMAFLPDGRLYILSKGGAVRLFDPGTGTSTVAANLAVSNVKEDGLHSIALDPGFAANRRVFLLFGVSSPAQAIVVARFTAQANGNLDPGSRRDLLTVPYSITASDEHNTGTLAFDGQGNLFIGLGDNTSNFFSGPTMGYAPRDPARPSYDAQRTAANTNDLRGKILRIRPREDGGYDIPSGNLFPAGTAQARPEIYAMGLRHPFRVTVDAQTGWLYWAEPGPNATGDSPSQGPRGYDEINQAKGPGNFGWPYCIADNFCYTQYNYQTNTGGSVYNPGALRNTSPNNTGMTDLPAARPAWIWYPYNAAGTAFPVFGNASTNTAMVGPLYRYDASLASAVKLPRYYDRHLFLFDWARSHVHAVSVAEDGRALSVARFWDPSAPAPAIQNTMDMKVGPDGSLYFLNWVGSGYPRNGGQGNLVKLEYIGPPDPVLKPRPVEQAGGFLLAMAGQAVRLPPDVRRVEIFDLRGARTAVQERPAGATGWRISPAGSGLLRLRLMRD